jgi:hypothetical protein
MHDEEVPMDVTPKDPDRFKHLPAPVRLEDTVSTHDATTHPEEKPDELREVEWLIRTTGGF